MKAKANLNKDETIGRQESILSTAESHWTSRLRHVTRRELKSSRPKANSSPRLYSNPNHSMTFNVDYASTPKKNQPRASTPSRMQAGIMRSLPAKKTIPPPLLSSSIRPSSSTHKKRKRCVECCCCTHDCARTSRGAASGSVGLSEKRVAKKPRRRTSLDCNRANSHLDKYPIRFMPNRRAQDIDRCNPVDDALVSCDLKPLLKNFYTFGDYNVWIL